MKWLDRWFIKRITWVKPLTNLTLGELYVLRRKVDDEIEVKIKAHNTKVKVKKIMDLSLVWVSCIKSLCRF